MVIALSAMLNDREIPAAVVQLDEVDHVAVQQAVDHVAEARAAEDQRQRPGNIIALAAVAAQHPDDEYRRRRAQADEEPALPARRRVRKRRRRAGVVATRTTLKNEVTVRLSPSWK